MITEDIKIVEEIFQEVEVGIVYGYDAFRYGVELGEGYIETELAVEKDGVEDWNAETDINGAKIFVWWTSYRQPPPAAVNHGSHLSCPIAKANK